jgi:hypothetical protein
MEIEMKKIRWGLLGAGMLCRRRDGTFFLAVGCY